MRSTPLFLVAVLTAGVVLAGCGSDGGGDNAASSGGAAAPAEAPERAPAQQRDQPAKGPDLRVDQRSIIYTGSITVRVENVTTAAAQATGIATAAGGFVGSDNRHSGDGADNATLELRVPAAKFATVVDELSELGTEERRGINTEDVTEQVVDLDARIAVQQARLDSGRRLLARANSLEDLVMLEREVATRESDLASLQAKKRRLADLTALSTISVVLLDPDADVAGGDDGPPGFLAGLKGGWDALLASLAVLVTVLGAVLPWLIALGLPVWGVVWAARRFGRRRVPAAAPAPAGMPAYGMPPYPGAAGARPGGEGHVTPEFVRAGGATTPAASGPAASGPATSGPATSGPATSGPATSGPATSGPATSGPATPGAVASGPAAPGTVASGPAAPGTVASGSLAPSPAAAGDAGRLAPGQAAPGQPSPEQAAPGSAASRAAAEKSGAPRPGTDGGPGAGSAPEPNPPAGPDADPPTSG